MQHLRIAADRAYAWRWASESDHSGGSLPVFGGRMHGERRRRADRIDVLGLVGRSRDLRGLGEP